MSTLKTSLRPEVGKMCDRILRQLKKSMSKTPALKSAALLGFAIGYGLLAVEPAPAQTAPQSATASTATAAAQRALLDQYCVTCHNDKTKIDNFSLQKEDINAV